MKSKYIIEGYTPEIIRQNPDLPNFQRDAFNKVSSNSFVSKPKTKQEQERLANLRELVKRSVKPIFSQ